MSTDLKKAFDASNGLSFDDQAGLFFEDIAPETLAGIELPAGSVVITPNHGMFYKFGASNSEWGKFSDSKESIVSEVIKKLTGEYHQAMAKNPPKKTWVTLGCVYNRKGLLNKLHVAIKQEREYRFRVSIDNGSPREFVTSGFKHSHHEGVVRTLNTRFEESFLVEIYTKENKSNWLLEWTEDLP